jgi:hypothetical protein
MASNEHDSGSVGHGHSDHGHGHRHGEYYSFVIPGAPLTLESGPVDLDQARNVLRELVQGQNLPVPISANRQTLVELHVVFHFPTTNNNNVAVLPVATTTSDMLDIARELTIGILYTDNTSIAIKSVRRSLRAIDGDDPIGCTRIQFRLLDENLSIEDSEIFS